MNQIFRCLKDNIGYRLQHNSVRAYSNENNAVLDAIFAASLALIPLLQHYVGPVYNAAITVLSVGAVYLAFKLLPELMSFNLSHISFVFITIIYQIYRVVNHGTTLVELGQSSVFIIFMVGIALGKINVCFMAWVAKCICLTASILLFVQYFCFYLLGFHIQLVPTSLFLESSEQWILCAQTGLAGITGKLGSFYRPSAFFLEPSHAYLYMFPVLTITLFEGKFDREAMWTAILISCGIVLTTSAMGIAAVLGLWCLFFLLRDERDGSFKLKNILRKRNLIAVGTVVVVFVLMVIFVPFVRNAVSRIFYTKTGVTAISGRIRSAMKLICSMTPIQWIFGVADNIHGITFNVPGSLGALYRHGLIGLVMSYDLYIKCVYKLELPYKLISLIIIVTSFFSAHTHSTVGMLYFLLLLMCGFQSDESRSIIVLSRKS